MRDYLQITNLKRSVLMGAAVALAGVPRILEGGIAVGVLVTSAFFLMTLVAGAVMAWGRKGGMVGAFPVKASMLRGVAVGGVVGIVFGLGRLLWGDETLRQALLVAGEAGRFELSFPTDLSGKIALVLWVAGFQVLFFQAGAMSFLSRLLGRWEYALIVLGLFRVSVTHIQFEQNGIPPIASAYLFSTLSTLVGATLFARCGLAAAVVFAALLEVRLLFT